MKEKKKISYKQLCFDVDEMTKGMRNIFNYVHTNQFKNIWLASSIDQQREALALIKAADKKGLVSWFSNHLSIDYGEKSFKSLVHFAKRYRIKNYSRLTRVALILELEKHDEEERQQQEDKEQQRIDHLFESCFPECNLQPEDSWADEDHS